MRENSLLTSTCQITKDSLNNMSLSETTTAGQFSTHDGRNGFPLPAHPQYNKSTNLINFDDGNNIFDQAFSTDGEHYERQNKKKRGHTAQGYGKRKNYLISQGK